VRCSTPSVSVSLPDAAAEYPLSAAYTSENASPASSGTRLCLVFSFLLAGSVLSAVVVLCCQAAGSSDEFTWRFAFAFGAALSAFSLVLRLRFAHDSKAFVRVQDARARLSTHLTAPLLDERESDDDDELPSLVTADTLSAAAALRLYWRPLVGTAGCWCLYDIVDYGFGLYSDDLLSGLHLSRVLGGSERVGTTAGVLLVNLLALPGGVIAAWLLPRLGRKRTLQAGTGGMLACYLAVAAGGARFPAALQLLLLACSNLFDALGPGAMTYVIPGEVRELPPPAICALPSHSPRRSLAPRDSRPCTDIPSECPCHVPRHLGGGGQGGSRLGRRWLRLALFRHRPAAHVRRLWSALRMAAGPQPALSA